MTDISRRASHFASLLILQNFQNNPILKYPKENGAVGYTWCGTLLIIYYLFKLQLQGIEKGFAVQPLSVLEGDVEWLPKFLERNHPDFEAKIFVYDDSLSPTVLAKLFKSWLESQDRTKLRERRGNVGNRDLKNQLMKLGAYRLLKYAGNDFTEASRLYDLHFGDDTAYSNQSAWSRVKSEVEKILEERFTI